jgi:hypothetical protein
LSEPPAAIEATPVPPVVSATALLPRVPTPPAAVTFTRGNHRPGAPRSLHLAE